MADRRKLAQGLMMMTPAMRADLAGREQGLSGIKYYDAGSRSKAQNIEDATRNYVVFSDEIPQILERNNIPVNK